MIIDTLNGRHFLAYVDRRANPKPRVKPPAGRTPSRVSLQPTLDPPAAPSPVHSSLTPSSSSTQLSPPPVASEAAESEFMQSSMVSSSDDLAVKPETTTPSQSRKRRQTPVKGELQPGSESQVIREKPADTIAFIHLKNLNLDMSTLKGSRGLRLSSQTDHIMAPLMNLAQATDALQLLVEDLAFMSPEAVIVTQSVQAADDVPQEAAPRELTLAIFGNGLSEIRSYLYIRKTIDRHIAIYDKLTSISKTYAARQRLAAGLRAFDTQQKQLYPEAHNTESSSTMSDGPEPEGTLPYLQHVAGQLQATKALVLDDQHQLFESTLAEVRKGIQSGEGLATLKRMHFPHVLKTLGLASQPRVSGNPSVSSSSSKDVQNPYSLMPQNTKGRIPDAVPQQVNGGIQFGDVTLEDDGSIRSQTGSATAKCAADEVSETLLNAPPLPQAGRIQWEQLCEEYRIWLHSPVYLDDDEEFDDLEQEELSGEPAFLMAEPDEAIEEALRKYPLSGEEACALAAKANQVAGVSVEIARGRAALLSSARRAAKREALAHVPPPLLRVDAPIGTFSPAQSIWGSLARSWPLMPPAPELCSDAAQWQALGDRFRRCAKTVLPAMSVLILKGEGFLLKLRELAMTQLHFLEQLSNKIKNSAHRAPTRGRNALTLASMVENLFLADTELTAFVVNHDATGLPLQDTVVALAQEATHLPIAFAPEMEQAISDYLKAMRDATPSVDTNLPAVFTDHQRWAGLQLVLRRLFKCLRFVKASQTFLLALNEYMSSIPGFTPAEKVVTARILRSAGYVNAYVQRPDGEWYLPVSSLEALAVNVGTWPHSPAAMLRHAIRQHEEKISSPNQ